MRADSLVATRGRWRRGEAAGPRLSDSPTPPRPSSLPLPWRRATTGSSERQRAADDERDAGGGWGWSLARSAIWRRLGARALDDGRVLGWRRTDSKVLCSGLAADSVSIRMGAGGWLRPPWHYRGRTRCALEIEERESSASVADVFQYAAAATFTLKPSCSTGYRPPVRTA